MGTSLFICVKTACIAIEKIYKAILPFLVPLVKAGNTASFGESGSRERTAPDVQRQPGGRAGALSVLELSGLLESVHCAGGYVKQLNVVSDDWIHAIDPQEIIHTPPDPGTGDHSGCSAQ